MPAGWLTFPTPPAPPPKGPLLPVHSPLRHALRRTVQTGAISCTAYLTAMLLDMRITGNRYDDRVFWGGYLTRNPKHQRLVGTFFIYGVGTVVGAVYRSLLPRFPRLPGPLLGALFVEAENTLRWPALATMNRLHPAVRNGTLPDLSTGEYFVLEAYRHTVFGLVLGTLVRRERRG